MSSLSDPGTKTHTISTLLRNRRQEFGAFATAIVAPTPSSVNVQLFQGYTADLHIDRRPWQAHVRRQLICHPAELYRSPSARSSAIHTHRNSSYALFTFGADLGARPPAAAPLSFASRGWGWVAFDCTRRTSTFLLCAFREQGRHPASSA